MLSQGHQFKAPRYASYVEAAEQALAYCKLTPATDFGGLHIEPLFEGAERELTGYTIRVADRDGYTLGYVSPDQLAQASR